MFSVRPEKIHLLDPGAPADAGMCSAAGCIRDVAYLGVLTRYTVELDGGGELIVVEQNLNTTSMDALAARNRPVLLVWQREHNRVIGEAG